MWAGTFWLACAAERANAQQLTPDQVAAQMLDAGRRAYNDRNLPVATERFREFLKNFGGHKDANHARFGLGLALLETPGSDLAAIVETLRGPADQADFAERPLALYHLSAAQRAIGNNALAQAALKPNEAPQHKQVAAGQFDLASKGFDLAAQGFAARAKAAMPPESGKAQAEWGVRARCDQAEMLLKLGKTKEAQALVDPILKDPATAASVYVNLLRYYAGHAHYTLGESVPAAQQLSQLAPFDDPVFGVHARYMLARTHHLAGDRAEAMLHYAALTAYFDAQVAAAKAQLPNLPNIKDVVVRARIEDLTKNPPPDYVARAWFYAGVVLYEQEKFAESLDRFTKFLTQYPNSPLLPEAQLRKGFCHVRLRQNPEAIATLTPIQDHPTLGDQARWWLGRAHVGQADPANPPVFAQQIGTALAHLKVASDRAAQLVAQDPPAKQRRLDQLLEMADVQQSAKQFNEAAATLQVVLNEQPDVERAQQALQRQAVALHLAGKLKESDDACVKFAQTYPQSPLGASVAFRFAENQFALSEAGFANPQLPNRVEALKALYGEAIKRYQQFLAKFPEFPYVNVARQGLGMSHYRLGEFELAIAAFKTIPDADRSGDLKDVSYTLADCLIRTAPDGADDAISAGLMLEQLGEAVKLLDSFIAGQPQNPLLPEALVKLGDCHQRVAGVMIDGPDRNNTLQLSRAAYEKVMQTFAAHPMFPVAVYERARCMLAQKDPNGALNEWNRFLADPLRNAPVAPIAALRLATLHRSQNRPLDAVKALEQLRGQHEGALVADPARAAWAPLLQYHHALALKEGAKLPEAQALFENLVQRFPASAEAPEAAWRAGQCRKDQVLLKLEAARATLAKADAKPEEKAAALPIIADCQKQIGEISTYFEQQATAWAAKVPGSDPHLRMFYEAAWCQRLLAEFEVAAARAKLQDEALKKLQDEATKATPAGQPVPKVNPPEIALTLVPLQPTEQKVRQLYGALLSAGPEAPLAPIAHLELAEVQADRGELDPAIQRLKEALAKDPPEEVAEKMRLRLGNCFLLKQDPKSAAAEFEQVAANDKSKLAPEARYRTAEALMAATDWAKAITLLVPFRDKPELHNLPQLSDRAVLRLGHAYAHAGQWDPARQAFETQLGRYPQSTWRQEAVYGVAWCLQNQNQFDNAVNTYVQVTRSTQTEVASRAQLQIGLCRLAQQRYAEAANALLVVPFTYDYPEQSALALCEAARALTELKQTAEASNLLKRVIKDHPTSKWADVAKERLAKLVP